MKCALPSLLGNRLLSLCLVLTTLFAAYRLEARQMLLFDMPDNRSSDLMTTLVADVVTNPAQLASSSVKLVSPKRGEILYCPGSSVQLRWNQVVGITNYFIEVASDSAMTTVLRHDVVPFDTSTTIPLGSQTTYYWKVSTGSEESEVQSFRIGSVTTPTFQSRFNGAVISVDTLLIQWNADPGAKLYQLEIQSPLSEAYDTTCTTPYFKLQLNADQQYRWKVRSQCPTATSAWSEMDSATYHPAVNWVIDDNSSMYTFPNPVHEFMTLQLVDGTLPDLSTIKCFTLNGEFISLPMSIINDHQVSVDCRNLSSGRYTLHMISGNRIIPIQLLVIH